MIYFCLHAIVGFKSRPRLYSCAFKTEQRLVAVLRKEQFSPSQEVDGEYLMDEWMDPGAIFNRDAVRLWWGHPAKNDQATLAVSA